MVADQLRISQGWVRCGMCQNVFDASEDLQSVPDELLQSSADQAIEPSQSTEPASAEQKFAPVSGADSLNDIRTSEQFDSKIVAKPLVEPAVAPVASVTDAEPEAQVLPEPQSEVANAESEPVDSADDAPSFVDQAKPLLAASADIEAEPQKSADETADAELVEPSADVEPSAEAEAEDAADEVVEAESVADEPKAEESSTDAESADKPPVDDDVEVISEQALLSTDVDDVRREVNAAQPVDDEEAADEKPQAVDEPGFVRQARRQAFWQSTGMRVALVLGSVLAAGGMAAQYAWQQRDVLAAEHPALAPVLVKVCQTMGCELQARREIADVVISGSGFKQLADANQYQWSLTLENRSDAPVATPMAELTLTDAQDKPLLRRVVDLKPLGAPQQLQPRQEWSVNVPVLVQQLSSPVSGYRALVFYP